MKECSVCCGTGQVYIYPDAFATPEDEAKFDYTCPFCDGTGADKEDKT